MSTEENKALVSQFVEGLNNMEIGLIDEIYAAHDSVYRPTNAESQSLVGLQETLTVDLCRIFPNGRYTTEKLLANGDKVLWYWTFNPTANQQENEDEEIVFRGTNMFRTEGGKIVEDLRIGAIEVA